MTLSRLVQCAHCAVGRRHPLPGQLWMGLLVESDALSFGLSGSGP